MPISREEVERVRLSTFAIMSLIVFSTVSAEIIPPDRRIDWSDAGIPGGIPQRTTICTTLNAATYGNGITDATSAIQQALENCPDNQVVYLPAGTYRITDTVHLYDNDTLRGAGMGKTIIRLESDARSAVDIRGSFNWAVTGVKKIYRVTGGMGKGSTQITLNSVADVNRGDEMVIDMLNDGDTVDALGSEGFCDYCGREEGTRTHGQIVEVKGVSGNTVTISPPLYWDLSPDLSPEAVLVDDNWLIRHAGIENLTVTQKPVPQGQDPHTMYLVEIDGAAYSWLRRVELENADWRLVWMIESLHNEIRENYFHTGINGYGRAHGYGVLLDMFTSATLAEDNIFWSLDGGCIMTGGGASGNVIAYNYLIDPRYDDAWWMTPSPSLNHNPHPSMNLWEGNYGYQAEADDIHGSSSHNTVFRSVSTGYQNVTITEFNNAVCLGYRQRYYNFVGNILGTSGWSQVYEVAYPQDADSSVKTIWRLGHSGPNDAGETQVKATLLRHGNFDYVTNSVQWDSAIPDHDIPASLYLASKPSWFGSVPYPPIGPDVTGMVNKIPAQLRYEAMVSGSTCTTLGGTCCSQSCTGTTVGATDCSCCIGSCTASLCGNGVCAGGETCSTCSQDCHKNTDADLSPCDGCITTTELNSYISQWQAGTASISSLIEAIRQWKAGCG
jgi:hypothetical protein